MDPTNGYFAVSDLGAGFTKMEKINLYKLFHRRSNKHCTVSEQAYGVWSQAGEYLCGMCFSHVFCL